MSRRFLLHGLAVPPVEAERQTLWYHGTAGEDVARSIVQEGYLHPTPQAEFYTDPDIVPVPGRVYLTKDPVFALAFSILRRYGPHSRAVVADPVYILEVEGKDLIDVEPDEDLVGALIFSAKHPQLLRMALEKLYPNWNPHHPPIVYQEKLRMLWRSSAALGKRLLACLDPEERRLFLNMPEVRNIAHVGPVPVSGGQAVFLIHDDRMWEAIRGLKQGRWKLFREWAHPALKTAKRIF